MANERKRKSPTANITRAKVKKEIMVPIEPSIIKAFDCKKPRFYKSQRVFEETGAYFLDKENVLIVEHNVLNGDDLKNYLSEVMKVERSSVFSGFAMKPRYEVCYTETGDPYIYSHRTHPTEKYPKHVKDLVPKFLKATDNNLGKATPYKKLSNGVDIVYGPNFDRGGSISPHSDDEMPWGLVIIFSLGQTRWFRIRCKKTRQYYNIKMPHNSLICMHGDTFQERYTHQVDKLKANEDVHHRLSLNLRFLKT